MSDPVRMPDCIDRLEAAEVERDAFALANERLRQAILAIAERRQDVDRTLSVGAHGPLLKAIEAARRLVE